MLTSSKPPFQPLMMTQVNTAPLTDLTHVSTFSGGGGTCLGFRLAGFRTIWANDIEQHARDCYAANLGSPIDDHDIRHLNATDILTATGLSIGELDVFEGSPPCTAFSTAGKRAKGWNQTKEHAGHVQTNVEDLFYEWLRLLEGLQPKAFVAENVAGMAKGVAKGYFKDILRKMKALGYVSEARLLDAQWLGVPQQRTRLIFMGLRADLDRTPQWPVPLPYCYSVRDALPWIDRLWAIIHDTGTGGTHSIGVLPAPAPAPALVAQRSTMHVHDGLTRRRFTIDEVKRICSFPDDYVMTGSYAQQWARLGNSVPPLMAKAIAESLRDVLLSVKVGEAVRA